MKVKFESDRPAEQTSFGVTLVPGVQELPDDVAKAMLAAGAEGLSLVSDAFDALPLVSEKLDGLPLVADKIDEIARLSSKVSDNVERAAEQFVGVTTPQPDAQFTGEPPRAPRAPRKKEA
jgi:hypothetical protein